MRHAYMYVRVAWCAPKGKSEMSTTDSRPTDARMADIRRAIALRTLFNAIRAAIPCPADRAPVMSAAIAYGTAEREVSRG